MKVPLTKSKMGRRVDCTGCQMLKMDGEQFYERSVPLVPRLNPKYLGNTRHLLAQY